MTNEDQAEFWTDAAGPKWVAQQDAMDALLAPVLDLVIEQADIQNGDRVLDIGCGTGVSVEAAAHAVGKDGHATGLDISQTMLDRAATRLERFLHVTLLRADAQTHAFDTAYDAMISRFGVMFFDDSIAAFANLNTALNDGGRMTFAAWGPAPQNPYFMVPARVAASVLGPMPKTDRTLPGPVAFEDSARTLDMMTKAGLGDPSAHTFAVELTPPGDQADTAALMMQIGPAEAAVKYHAATTDLAAAVEAALAHELNQFDTGRGLRIPACIHIYSARKPA